MESQVDEMRPKMSDWLSLCVNDRAWSVETRAEITLEIRSSTASADAGGSSNEADKEVRPAANFSGKELCRLGPMLASPQLTISSYGPSCVGFKAYNC